MRIVSLLPSATEIVYALGLGDQLVGVTDECDYPPEARRVRVVTRSALPAGAAPAEVDRLVSASVGVGEPIYRLDRDAVRELRPDLVLSQDLCAVCAVPSGHVTEALDVLGCSAEVVSLDPNGLADVLDSVRQVAKAAGVEERAEEVVASLAQRVEAVRAAVAGRARRRVFALEWSDPPFNGGHWVPEMIEVAGGTPVLGNPGTPSARVAWEDIARAAPDVTVFMPCGYELEAAVDEARRTLIDRAELGGELVVVHANAYFSRPGPRLVDGVEVLAAVLHPGAVPAPPDGRFARVR